MTSEKEQRRGQGTYLSCTRGAWWSRGGPNKGSRPGAEEPRSHTLQQQRSPGAGLAREQGKNPHASLWALPLSL